MRRTVMTIAFLAVSVAACGSTGSGDDSASGFVVIDSSGSQLCGVLLESFPPQCGDLVVRLGDLRPDEVVALQAPDDPALGDVLWTDYALGVSGSTTDGVMTDVTLTDPVALGNSDGLIIRVVDLGITQGEPVTFPVDLRNASDSAQPLTFTSGQRVEVTFSTEGTEVYRWSDGYAFTAAIDEQTLEAGEVFGVVVTGDPIDLPPGTYDAQAWVTATETLDVVAQWRATIEG